MKKTVIICFFASLLTLSVKAQVAEKTKAIPPETIREKNAAAFRSEPLIMEAYTSFDSTEVKTGFLYNRVSSALAGLENFTGTTHSKPLTKDRFKQICFELEKANVKKKTTGCLATYRSLDTKGSAAIPIMLINYNYQCVKKNAEDKGLIKKRNGRFYRSGSESPFETKQVFAANAVQDETYQGKSVQFNLKKEAYFSNTNKDVKSVQVDFADGRGFQDIEFDQDIAVSYATPGTKMITLKITDATNTTLTSSFVFKVMSVTLKHPDEVYPLNQTIPYPLGNPVFQTSGGVLGLYKSPVTGTIKKPILFLEGLDLGNERTIEILYAALSGITDPSFGWPNGPDMAQCLLNNGYDLFILNFNLSEVEVQANAMVAISAIQKINSLKDGSNELIVIGASMGGLVGRYALDFMENNQALTGKHNTRLFVSFDSPQQYANVPLGDQYWIDFFASESLEAEEKSGQLHSPAPQQMLIYHAASYPAENPYRKTLMNELAASGYPKKCRNIAIANGAANGLKQDFNPGDQLLSWRYNSAEVDLIGNTWALPDYTTPQQTIVHCLLDKAGSQYKSLEVKVPGHQPYDNAPGGMRTTNKEIADSETEIEVSWPLDWTLSGGDIKTTHPTHCFIPTISALDINTTDLNYNIMADPNILAKTPFNEIYYPGKTPGYPVVNQPHIYFSAETVNWVLNELLPVERVLNQNTGNTGDISAQKSVTLLPGVDAPAGSLLCVTIEAPLSCSVSLPQKPGTDVAVNNVIEPEPARSELKDLSFTTIFPNPGTGDFTILSHRNESVEVEVYNTLGGLVLKEQHNLSGGSSKMDLSGKEKGVYFIKLIFKDGSFEKKTVLLQ